MSNFSGAMDDARQFTENLCSIIESLEAEIAELRAKQHQLWDIKEAIRVENFELWSKNERLEAERDDLQRQVQEARDENERLRDLVDVLGKHATIPSEHIRFKGMTDIRYKEPEDDFPCCSSRSTGYADEGHQDAEITDWHQPTPRLTVHDLEVAPEGSQLARLFHNDRKKADDGRWHKAWMFEGQRAETSEELIAEGWADATLTTPEADDE